VTSIGLTNRARRRRYQPVKTTTRRLTEKTTVTFVKTARHHPEIRLARENDLENLVIL